MSYLFVCNTSSDCVSKVDLNMFKEENKITLNSNGFSKIGPHGICRYKDKLITANSYGNSISIIDIKENNEESNHFIGMHCNDVIVYDNNAYIICGELNNVVVFDLIKSKLVEEIPCGNLPHSIVLNKEKKLLLICNMENDTVTLIDCINRENTKNIKVGAYPTKAVFSVDGQYIFVCESNLGSDSRGSISIISLKNFKVLYRITVGNSPVDMYTDEKYCYVSNFGEGTVSILDINCYKQLKKLNIGGMPRGIIKNSKDIYVGDNYNNLLIKIDIENGEKKNIPIGGEPTGIILV
ncbi:YncE family protein [Clostridium rectalis]|uniref:YncE family protein n=1 Tax=Clostridium rectalis TaxID=2040295 RepID=UPI000F6435D0|nr:YncE family protein [Clostridium rectalis]